jgi:hypothetical protein
VSTLGTIAVSGGLAQRPGRGGHAWVFLTWLLALRRLGWSVLFIDRLEAEWIGGSVADSAEARWLAQVMEGFDLGDSWALLHDGGTSSLGLAPDAVADRLDDAAALVNVMGFLEDPALLARPRRRIYLDIDPGWSQMWKQLGLHDGFAGHESHVTVGRNIGGRECEIPTCGIEWVPIWPPVLLDEWPAQPPSGELEFTSVATWRGPNDALEFEGRRYGLRAHTFRQLAGLPRQTGAEFRLALALDPGDERDRELLVENGWRLEDPLRAAGDPDSYREFVRGSGAEIAVAKELYARSKSGWFSDRSSAYMAAGKPVLALDTGLPGGPDGGLLVYRTLAEASRGVEAIQADPAGHGAAARAFAERHLDAERVIGELLDGLGVR